MRQDNFSDLRRMSGAEASSAKLDPLEPVLEPVFIR
jgi:hypothetical protein